MKLGLLLACFFFVLLSVPAQSRRLHRKFKPRFNFGKQPEQLNVIDDKIDDDADEDDVDEEWVFKMQEPDGRCNPNPCLNNGVCTERGSRNFKCDCPAPFKGKRCQKGPRVCKRGTCGRGDCVITSTAPFYECKCNEPFQPPNCRQAAEVCQNNPCKNGGTCVPDGTDFRCDCSEGFEGRLCHVGPQDCYQGDGESYRGNVSEAQNGVQCLYWNSHFILRTGTNPFTAFEDPDGLGPHNFCRNPDGDRQPWCFIRRGRRVQWEYCNVRRCSTEAGSTVAPVPTTTADLSPTQFSSCGKPQPMRLASRIYGGLKSVPGAIPWQLSLQVNTRGQRYSHICGGALIDSCWALTAAHCISGNSDMRVVLGGLTLDSDEPAEQIIEVERAIVHNGYDSNSLSNDIALLKLKATNGVCARETRFVKAACLPDTALPYGKECTVSGWGATEESNSGSSHLLEAEVLLINSNTCSRPSVLGNSLDDGMICAGYLEGGVDSCQGDSGGPLTCDNDSTHVVYGLVSWGYGCALRNKPGVYTRVIHFLNWIKTNMVA